MATKAAKAPKKKSVKNSKVAAKTTPSLKKRNIKNPKMATTPPKPPKKNGNTAKNYNHPESDSLMRPDIGTQPHFKKKKEPQKYRYDSSLSPTMEFDGQNPAREQGEALVRECLDEIRTALSLVDASNPKAKEQKAALRKASEANDKLRRLSKPFLNWAGKAERLSFDVPTLPLFIHERLSTKAILETLKGHKRDKQIDMFDLFGDPGHSITDQVLKAYEHRDRWVNRMVLGDSLVVMNSLLQYEGLGGKVQMIYMDPPYGVKFGSNFQPFVRKRDVAHGDDEDMTREPEMVQAYRDTWELGLHSYLTYMRDRLALCRDLLAPSGSIFVQISDENLHHVRELLDEVFGADNLILLITFSKTTSLGSKYLPSSCDYLLWYARDIDAIKYRQLFTPRPPIDDPTERYVCVETNKGEIIDLSYSQKSGLEPIPEGRILKLDNLTSQDPVESLRYPIKFNGRTYIPSARRHWATHQNGIERLIQAGRIHAQGENIWYKRYRSDFSFRLVGDIWTDVKTNAFGDPRYYVVQTGTSVVERCMLMTTDPGDLVLDPTCGSGTTAYVAEQWGRRWITTDVSRVPLALARQRLLTATYPWFELKDDNRGPAGGFIYKRKQNNKEEEVGGIVPHITLGGIANNEKEAEEILVDRPEVTNKVTRVTGAFSIESTIPTPAAAESDETNQATDDANGEPFVSRMLEVLRKSPILRLPGNKTATFKNIRPPAKTLTLSAEGVLVNGQDKAVAFVSARRTEPSRNNWSTKRHEKRT